MNGPPASRPQAARIAVALALMAAAWLLSRSPLLEEGRAASGAREVPGAAFGSGDMTTLLTRIGAAHALPPSRPRSAAPRDAESLGLAPSRPLRPSEQRRYGLDGVPADRLAQRLLIDPRWLRPGLSVLSILIDPLAVVGLHENENRRGRAWERPAYVAWVEDGRLELGSWAGLRVHGGSSRDGSKLHRSYRLYFRNDYGRTAFDADLFPSRAGSPPRQLVVRSDGGVYPPGESWHFMSPLGYDVARRLGLLAPETRTAALYLNGHFMGVKQLTEWVHLDFLEARFGPGSWVLARTKVGQNAQTRELLREGDPRRWEELTAAIKLPPDARRAWAEARVDVDNLFRWFLTTLFCGTLDAYQGTLALNASRADARWFMVPWDLDLSFGLRNVERAWERDSFREMTTRHEPQARLLQALLAPASQHRPGFARLFVEAMNHRLDAGFLADRLAHYRRLAALYHPDENTGDTLDGIADYLARRPAVLRRHLADHLELGPSRRVEVVAPAGRRLVIDGFETATPYAGWYFEATPITVAAAPGDGELSHWLVDGVRAGDAGDRLSLSPRADTRLEAVSADGG